MSSLDIVTEDYIEEAKRKAKIVRDKQKEDSLF